jgi:hypothetical protein
MLSPLRESWTRVAGSFTKCFSVEAMISANSRIVGEARYALRDLGNVSGHYTLHLIQSVAEMSV